MRLPRLCICRPVNSRVSGCVKRWVQLAGHWLGGEVYEVRPGGMDSCGWPTMRKPARQTHACRQDKSAASQASPQHVANIGQKCCAYVVKAKLPIASMSVLSKYGASMGQADGACISQVLL